jgi:hypothetical protein
MNPQMDPSSTIETRILLKELEKQQTQNIRLLKAVTYAIGHLGLDHKKRAESILAGMDVNQKTGDEK